MSCVLGTGTPRPGTPRPGIPRPSTVPPDIPFLLGSQRPGAPRPSPLQLQALQVNRNIEESRPTSPNNSTALRNLFPSHLPSLPDVTQGGGFQSLAGGGLQSVSEASRLIRTLFSPQVQHLPDIHESDGNTPSCSYGKTDESKEFLCMLDKFQKEVKGGVEVLNDVEDKELRKQIVAKEDLLEKQRSLAENFVQYKKEEYAQLITGVEQARNLKARKDEELFRLDFERAQIIRECEDQNEFVEHLTNKKRKFQEITPMSMKAFKEVIGTLDQELKDLKTKHIHYHEDKKQKQGELLGAGPNLALLDYISKKIEVKEGELECPVCFEVASAPIFMCSSEHLVCSACRTRVTRCPECRKTYTIERRRHRFAEKASTELEVLYRERAEVLGN